MNRVWWMDPFGMMFQPSSGDRKTIEQLTGKVVSVTAAHADDCEGMADYKYIVVTDEPTIGELLDTAALAEVLVIEPQPQEEVIRHVPRVRPLGQRRVWMECLHRRLD